MVPVSIPVHLLAILVIGVGFGSVVSVFFLLLSQKFNSDKASSLFARLNISYGLAGLMAPAITGSLFDLYDGYDIPLMFTLAVGIIGVMGISVKVAVRLII